MYSDAFGKKPEKDVLDRFSDCFEATLDGSLRFTMKGAQSLIPRLVRHQLCVLSPATVDQVRRTLEDLLEAEQQGMLRKLDLLLSRDDLSDVERAVFESLQSVGALKSASTAGLVVEPAKVVSLADWKARKA